jgi:hypothetical protein
MKTPNPRCFGVLGGIGRKAEVQNPNGVSAKCAIPINLIGILIGLNRPRYLNKLLTIKAFSKTRN